MQDLPLLCLVHAVWAVFLQSEAWTSSICISACLLEMQILRLCLGPSE